MSVVQELMRNHESWSRSADGVLAMLEGATRHSVFPEGLLSFYRKEAHQLDPFSESPGAHDGDVAPWFPPHVGGRAPVVDPLEALRHDIPNVGGRAPWVAEGTHVDIFFSAGPHDPDYRSKTGQSCNWQVTTTCSIYRVRWLVSRRIPIAVEKVVPVGNDSAFHPSVSPNGDRLAWMASSASDATSKDRQVHVMDLDTGVTTALFDSYLRGVLHPHWYCQDTVLLNYTTENLHMLLKVRADGSGVSESLVTSLGVDIYHVEDPVTLFSPPDVGACGRSPDPAIVATVDQDTKESPSIPHVLSIVPGSTLDETFDLSLATGEPDEVNIEGDALRTFVGCHHPAWSPEGGQVMCTNLDDPEREERISIDGFHHNLEFRFTPTCSAGAITWGNAVRAFPPIDPTSLATAFTAFAGK